MEASVYHHFSSSSFSSYNPSISFRPLQTHRILVGLAVGTPKSSWKLNPRLSFLQRVEPRALASESSQGSEIGTESDIGGELESGMNSEEWMELGGRRENCKGRRGLAEVLECLEEEAIMGEDEGREAADYNRRARIFDKSSRVFQVLKERKTHSHVEIE